MAARFEDDYRPPTPDEFRVFTKPTTPPLDPDRLAIDLLNGGERSRLTVSTTGDFSLLLSYEKNGRKREGFVASLEEPTPGELHVVQFQGAKQAGHRLNQGLDVVRLFSVEISKIAHSAGRYARLCMQLDTLAGQSVANYIPPIGGPDVPPAVRRYERLAHELGLAPKGDIYTREIANSHESRGT